MSNSLWIAGPVRSGKTSRLVSWLQTWMQVRAVSQQGVSTADHNRLQQAQSRTALHPDSILVFTANADNRIDLANQISSATAGHYSIDSTTPLSFFQEQVVLFWPLLLQQLKLNAQFPLRLRPENEQELAAQLWSQELSVLQVKGVSPEHLVRQALDLLQLAAFSGTPIERVATFLQEGFAEQATPSAWQCLGELLIRWRDWCLDRGFLTYGILTELYWRHLLPNPTYQEHLARRYRVVLADDVDNYPAIARNLFDVLLDQGAIGVFTYNPDGAIRLGLGADPEYLSGLSHRCVMETLSQPISCLRKTIGPSVVEFLQTPTLSLPGSVQSIQTTSRAQLLRQTAETIIQAVKSGQVEPQEVAVIGPGLDAIAHYTLTEILSRQGILVESLNEQRPLISSPIIRALLTLLVFVYPGLGRSVSRDQVSEMLVVLSLKRGFGDSASADSETTSRVRIDPVRAGLLADYCFEPHPERPRLLPATTFPRWDRLGYQATTVYQEILQWLSEQGLQQEQRLIPNPISVLDRAIQHFLWPSNLSYDQLAALRELLETAQHYWKVDARLSQSGYNFNSDEVFSKGSLSSPPSQATVSRFIKLLWSGTITANPFPVRTTNQTNRVMIATTFQYRSSHQTHRWQFWLDAGSTLWNGGGAVVLWGAPCFLKGWSRQAWTVQEEINNDQEQLRRLLLDLLSRVEERVYLCHSDLSISGQEQTGPLLPLVDASTPLASVLL